MIETDVKVSIWDFLGNVKTEFERLSVKMSNILTSFDFDDSNTFSINIQFLSNLMSLKSSIVTELACPTY